GIGYADSRAWCYKHNADGKRLALNKHISSLFKCRQPGNRLPIFLYIGARRDVIGIAWNRLTELLNWMATGVNDVVRTSTVADGQHKSVPEDLTHFVFSAEPFLTVSVHFAAVSSPITILPYSEFETADLHAPMIKQTFHENALWRTI